MIFALHRRHCVILLMVLSQFCDVCLRAVFVFAEVDFCLQRCVHVCNDGSLFAGMYLCWATVGLYVQIWFMSAASKQG
jgi:hypothetical protein